METIRNFKNDLLKRQEISLILESEKNPSFDEVRNKVSEDFKKQEDVIEINGINGSFGSNKFRIDAYIYDSKEDLEKNKVKTKKQKQGEGKAEEVKAEAKTEETAEKEEAKAGKKEAKAEEKPEEKAE